MAKSARVSEDDNPFLVRLGEFLQRKREKKNITQVYIGRILGIDRSEISRIEYGNRDFHVSYLPVFSKAYDFPMNQYFREEGICESIHKVQDAVQCKIEQISRREKLKRLGPDTALDKKLVAKVYEIDGKEVGEKAEVSKKQKPNEIMQFLHRFDKYEENPLNPDSVEDIDSLTEDNLRLIEKTKVALDFLAELKDAEGKNALSEHIADYILVDVYGNAAKEGDEFAKRMCAYISKLGKEHLIRCNITDFD